MAIAPTIKYFGQLPTTIIFQTSDDFDGGPQLSLPVITPGEYTFPQQSGGGLYNFHEEAILIKNIEFVGSGSSTINMIIAGVPTKIATLPDVGSDNLVARDVILTPGQWLSFTSSGGPTGPKKIAVTALLTNAVWSI